MRILGWLKSILVLTFFLNNVQFFFQIPLSKIIDTMRIMRSLDFLEEGYYVVGQVEFFTRFQAYFNALGAIIYFQAFKRVHLRQIVFTFVEVYFAYLIESPRNLLFFVVIRNRFVLLEILYFFHQRVNSTVHYIS